MSNHVATTNPKGSTVNWHGRPYVVEGEWSDDVSILLDQSTGRLHHAPSKELAAWTEQGPPTHHLEGISQEQWELAVTRYQVISKLVERGRPTTAAKEEAARALELSLPSINRLIGIYERGGGAVAFAHQRRGPRRGSRRLNEDVEKLLQELIETVWLKAEAPRLSVFTDEVRRRCTKKGLSPPGPMAIRSRLLRLPSRRAMLRRRGRKAAEALTAHPGSHVVARPLDEIQIDHTLVDLICVTDDVNRIPIARPYLTLAIDVKTRAIVGYYLSLDRPDAFAVGLCIAFSAMDKTELLADLGIEDVTWAMQGLPRRVFVDNAKEHHANALQRGCEANLIVLSYRPPGQPYFGGHIERLIGTMMHRLHALPGSTRSNVIERGEYKPEKHATMTFPEVHRYLVMQICAYNLTVHSELGMSPHQAWMQALTGAEGYRAPVVPPRTVQFLADFMPTEWRLVRRDGIELFGTRYWDPVLVPLIGHREKLAVHYDPRDMSRVFVRDPGGILLPAGYSDVTLPRFSRNEWAFIRRQARALGRRPDELAMRDELLNAADALVADSKQKRNKRAARRKERHTHGMTAVNQTYSLFNPPLPMPEDSSETTYPLNIDVPTFNTFAME